MKTIQNIPLSMLLLGAFVSQTSCVDASGTLRILRNQAPGEGCVVSGDESSLFISSGTIEVKADFGYYFTPLVESRAQSGTNTDRRIFIDGAVVKLNFADGFFDEATLAQLETDGLSHFTQPFSGSIAPQGTAGFGFEILPKAVLVAMESGLAAGEATRVSVDIEMRGSVDGGDVSSPTFTYPIEVCNGCLEQNVGLCASLTEDGSAGGACQPSQDGFLDCCTDAEGGLVCPAVAP